MTVYGVIDQIEGWFMAGAPGRVLPITRGFADRMNRIPKSSPQVRVTEVERDDDPVVWGSGERSLPHHPVNTMCLTSTTNVPFRGHFPALPATLR
jgi:hypothetical protein